MAIVLHLKLILQNIPINLEIYGVQNTLRGKFYFVNLREYLRVKMQVSVLSNN